MSVRPNEAELVKYLEGELTARRTKQIETMMADQPIIAEEIESLRRAFSLEKDLRDALCDSPEIETERRIEATLAETVVNQIDR